MGLVGLMALSACGMSEDEHKGLLSKALGEQKSSFNAEMKKMQAAGTEKLSGCEGEVKKRDQVILNLEGQITKLGGNIETIRTKLGAELASTRSELAATAGELKELTALRAKAEAEAAEQRRLAERLKGMIDAGQLEVVRRKGRLMLKLPDNILFPSGSKRLKKAGKKALVAVAGVLAEVKDRDFIISGHTDNVPVKRGGRFRNNWELSTARAVEVVQLMIKNSVGAAQLSAAGFGEFDPIAPNETKEGRQQNRRLEIILMPKIEAIE